MALVSMLEQLKDKHPEEVAATAQAAASIAGEPGNTLAGEGVW